MVTRFLAWIAAASLLTSAAYAQTIDRKTCGVAPGQNLIVFVGKKVDVREIHPPVDSGVVLLDNVFRARYRVLEVLCGQLPAREVEFDAYDHYGTPAFADVENVLLFLSREGGRLVHQKYQYVPVYQTADGAWAGCGDPYQFEPDVHRGSIRAKPRRYKQPVTFSIRGLSKRQIQERYPAAFFERRGDIVTCRAGASIQELFRVKRNGVLKAREIFR